MVLLWSHARIAGPSRSTIETPARSAELSQSGKIGACRGGQRDLVVRDNGVRFRNDDDAKKPESTAAVQLHCLWVASHQQETRQLRCRCPGSNASLRFIVDQTLAVECVSPIVVERGGG
jgi:hypothetical protein